MDYIVENNRPYRRFGNVWRDMIEYKIVSCYPAEEIFKIKKRGMDKLLQEEVNKWIEKGWKPIGGIAINPVGAFFQSMIREKPEY